MRKLYISTALWLAAAGIAGAQNLNPQVQVTNDYKTNMGEARKQAVELEIPDSLTSFKTRVDYSVFATDYKGAYEFSPYQIRMVPDMKRREASTLFVRAGAGFAFHPVLQAVYTPFGEGDHRLNVVQDFRGYAGDYTSLGDASWYKGHDFAENFGVTGSWKADKFLLDYGVGYKGIFTKDYTGTGSFNRIEAGAGIRSSETAALQYDAKLDLGFGRDTFEAVDPLYHTSAALEGSVMPKLELPFDVVIDARMQLDIYRSSKSSVVDFGNLFTGTLSPQALIDLDPVKLRAGISLSPGKEGLEIFPNINASMDFAGQQLFASFTGGQYALSYRDLKMADHWVNPYYMAEMSRSYEMINCKLGLRGAVLSHLQYELDGGFAIRESVPMHGLYYTSSDPGNERPECSIVFADYNLWYVHALAAWKSEKLDVEGALNVNHTNGPLRKDWLALPLFSYNVKAVYNWGRRIFAGLRINAATASESEDFTIDGFFDLGLYGEYKLNGLLSLWGQASNLLNHKIATAPTHIQSGLYLSAGLCLNLR